MSLQKKPYLIIPFLVEQPTWGGSYICEKKGWLNKEELRGKKIGQSYELYDRSLLATTITSSTDPLFGPKVQDSIPISHFTEKKPFPLIKFTQAKGNSFQLHAKPGSKDPYWQPKAESWYYFENGKITFGIKKGTDIGKYKNTCFRIEKKMKELSHKVMSNNLSVREAKEEALMFIREENPWQFVNVCEIKKGDVVDLSGGGLQHSWEEDENKYPLGNVLYEVQQDVMDPVSTIRSFDQGKIMQDGSIREIQIEEFFKHLDISEQRNTFAERKNNNSLLFDTPHYSLNKIDVSKKTTLSSISSFHHLFVQNGAISVESEEGSVFVSQGHSCFIPKGIIYTIDTSGVSEVLQTYMK